LKKEFAHSEFKIDPYLRHQKEVVDTYLDACLPASDSYPEIIHEAVRYSVFAGGKRIRPILALATGEALGGDVGKIIRLAGALEMIHTYSLIHDDLPAMDNDDYRRGRPTLHKRFGEGIAILAGDALLTLAFQVLGEIPGNSGIAETKVSIMRRICRAIGTKGGMIGGQVLDLTTQAKPFSSQQLEYIHRSKTGALIEASIYCAGQLSEASEEVCEKLGSFGSSIGLAFQIVDDLLDVEGSSREMGKASRKDNRKSKATYPALYGVEKSRKIVTELVDNAAQEITFLGSEGEVLRKLAWFISVRRF
jgi:geranylgeranyl diphosphate synthase type II